ncbi:MAG: M15 family metallopeptidase [Leptonema sp. (in: bacteria)]
MKILVSLFILLLVNYFLIAENFRNEDYLILFGIYKSQEISKFVNLKNYQIPTKGRNLFLQKEVAESLERMYLDLKKEHPNIEFWIASAARTYWDQKHIWELKWKQFSFLTPDSRVKKILEYSSMPGTSRHHWGTDFDINVLENSYYEKENGKILWDWLSKNAVKYGFCMPYNENRSSGYLLEKWHWSYKKIALVYQKKWNEYFAQKKINFLDFSGKEFFTEFAPIYVNSINPECL